VGHRVFEIWKKRSSKGGPITLGEEKLGNKKSDLKQKANRLPQRNINPAREHVGPGHKERKKSVGRISGNLQFKKYFRRRGRENFLIVAVPPINQSQGRGGREARLPKTETSKTEDKEHKSPLNSRKLNRARWGTIHADGKSQLRKMGGD